MDIKMKKVYLSPAIEVCEFIAEDIVCASTISFDGVKNYNIVEEGIGVNNGEQRVEAASGTAPEFYQ